MIETPPAGPELIGHFSTDSLINKQKKKRNDVLTYLLCTFNAWTWSMLQDQAWHLVVLNTHTLNCQGFGGAIATISC